MMFILINFLVWIMSKILNFQLNNNSFVLSILLMILLWLLLLFIFLLIFIEARYVQREFVKRLFKRAEENKVLEKKINKLP